MDSVCSVTRIYLIFQEKVVTGQFLFTILHGIQLVDSWSKVVGISAEGDLKLAEELVHSTQQRLRRVGERGDRGLALEHDDPVRQVGRHDEVVLHDETGLLGVEDEPLDDLGSH